ncbi:hypothetical protein C8J57DRAFT_1226091 [Mycena rebaudengoi]|nr:hypothetical protein C8J57DRAFT_1226091 [Mycena rebaudengoi]
MIPHAVVHLFHVAVQRIHHRSALPSSLSPAMQIKPEIHHDPRTHVTHVSNLQTPRLTGFEQSRDPSSISAPFSSAHGSRCIGPSYRPLPGPTKRAKGPGLNDGPKGLRPSGGIPGCGVLPGVGKKCLGAPGHEANVPMKTKVLNVQLHWDSIGKAGAPGSFKSWVGAPTPFPIFPGHPQDLRELPPNPQEWWELPVHPKPASILFYRDNQPNNYNHPKKEIRYFNT